MESDPLNPGKILETGLAFWPAKTLLSAVELGVFTELAKKPDTVQPLAERLGIHERGARDFFDTLVSLGFLQRDEAGVYSNAADTDAFLDKDKPSYIGGMLEMANSRLYPYWGKLTDALQTGKPQNEAARNPDFFAELYADPASLQEFLSAMTGVSRPANIGIANCPDIDWASRKTFVDAGTAQGDLVLQIATAQPHLAGIGFDLPQVEPVFQAYVEQGGVADRVVFEGGDFFNGDLPKADVILMGHILHDWNLEEKKLLIRKAFDALPDGGVFVVYDALIDDDRRENAFGLMMSLNMLVETPGGFDYTGADGIGWMLEAGFSEAKVCQLPGNAAIILATK